MTEPEPLAVVVTDAAADAHADDDGAAEPERDAVAQPEGVAVAEAVADAPADGEGDAAPDAEAVFTAVVVAVPVAGAEIVREPLVVGDGSDDRDGETV